MKFASGNPMTADDVVFSLQRAVKLNKSPGFILTQFGFTEDNVVEKIRQTDDITFDFDVAKPFAPTFVLNCLTSTVAMIVDKKLVMEHEVDGDFGNDWLKTDSAGSGAYNIRAWRANEEFVLERNAELRARRAPKTSASSTATSPSRPPQRLLLEKGDIDIARNLSKDQIAALSHEPRHRGRAGRQGLHLYLGLNQKNPNLAKPEVREALK